MAVCVIWWEGLVPISQFSFVSSCQLLVQKLRFYTSSDNTMKIHHLSWRELYVPSWDLFRFLPPVKHQQFYTQAQIRCLQHYSILLFSLSSHTQLLISAGLFPFQDVIHWDQRHISNKGPSYLHDSIPVITSGDLEKCEEGHPKVLKGGMTAHTLTGVLVVANWKEVIYRRKSEPLAIFQWKARDEKAVLCNINCNFISKST